MKTLGLNAYQRDASAALVIDGEFVNAVEEERLGRLKHSVGLVLVMGDHVVLR